MNETERVCYLLLRVLHVPPHQRAFEQTPKRFPIQFSLTYAGHVNIFIWKSFPHVVENSGIQWNCNDFVKFIWNTYVEFARIVFTCATRLQEIGVNHSEIRARALSLRTPHDFFFFRSVPPLPRKHRPTDFLCASAKVLRPKRKMKYSPFHALHSSVFFFRV